MYARNFKQVRDCVWVDCVRGQCTVSASTMAARCAMCSYPHTISLLLDRYLLHTRKDFHLIFSLVLSPSHSLTHTHTHMHTGSNNTNVSLFLSLSLSHTHTTHIRGLLTPAKFHAVLLFPHRWYVIILQVKDPMETLTQNAYMYLEIFMCIYIYIYKYATVYVLCIYTCV